MAEKPTSLVPVHTVRLPVQIRFGIEAALHATGTATRNTLTV